MSFVRVAPCANLKVQVQKYNIDWLECTEYKDNKNQSNKQGKAKRKKATKYLKTKESRLQIHNESTVIISQEFRNSKHKELFHLTTLMTRIRIGINAVPSKGTMFRFLKDPEARKSIGPQERVQGLNQRSPAGFAKR